MFYMAKTVIFYDTSPISKYCDERSAILNRLSEERIKQVEKIMQEFDLIPAKILDLLTRLSALESNFFFRSRVKDITMNKTPKMRPKRFSERFEATPAPIAAPTAFIPPRK